MHLISPILRAVTVGLGLLVAAFAAGAADAAPPAAVPPALAASAADPKLPPEPNIQRTVSEDDHVRIEELKVRGQTQSIVVQPKIPGVSPYQIITSTSGRALGASSDGTGGAVGSRVWQVLGF